MCICIINKKIQARWVSQVAMEGRLFSCALLMGLLWLCGSFGNLTSTAQSIMKLHKDEIPIVKTIATKLKVKFWDFSVDPCSGSNEWISTTVGSRNVTCGNCNVTTNICHVTSIELKSQNLGGVLPEEFANLTFLTKIDLSRNYLNGAIPTSWASLPLQYIAIMANRISGKIPDAIGKIATLQHLDVEGNLLEGSLPSTIGTLTNLIRICLNTNNFSGELPSTLGNLKTLRDFRINGNAFSGRIPSFIGNWKNLKILHMQGTTLEGPFPPVFSTLTSLQELIVTDMNGGGAFPSLMNNVKMKNIILRNCSITGEIPPYIGNQLRNLRRIDLSFNKLSGEIPASWNGLRFLSNMYLTNNNLNGSIPDWMFRAAKQLDLSYNSFTGPQVNSCPEGNLNLVSSFSSSENNKINSCLRRGFPCQQKAMNYQLFVNCGGRGVKINGNLYEEDSVNSGPANFFLSGDQRWASSSTGDFVGNSGVAYIATNTSVLKNMANPELYMSARLTPLSLRYYGLCLQNGTYTVNLHFAEIIFTNDQTFSDLGSRIFDVYIQHKKVLGNFNIAKEANGTGRSVVKSFNASVDKDGTLEIHFQWVGKGTISVPYQGVYGPLISAISVTPNFEPVKEKGEKGLSLGVIIGIVVTSVLLGSLIVILFVFCWRKKYKKDDGLESHFSLGQIKSATNNFDPVNKIGEGGFGPVYKGQLPDGTLIAVKQLSSKSKQGNREFLNEIGIISAVQHPNLVKLFGCCIGGNQLLLIYEYLENNSLARALFGPEGMKLNLQWQRRRKIGIDIARGLAYLHEESRLKIVHRDIKTTNVLLDKDLNAKISDFGLARLDEEENTHVSTRVVGTVGYMAPEYALWGHLSEKADVYSFGIVLLEIISGKSNANYRPSKEFVNLLDWAYVEQEEGNILALVDPALGLDYSKEEAEEMLNLSLLCSNQSPALRPAMSSVVSMLEGHMPVEVPSENTFQHYSPSNSTDGPYWTNSSNYASVQVQGVTTQSLP